MASDFQFKGGAAGQAGQARAAQMPSRHALGLPAGSVRALLAFMVLGIIWALMYLQKEIPLYLQYLMFMILGHYFAAHTRSITPADVREPSPLYLPRGFIRFMIFVGFAAVVALIYYQHRDDMGALLDKIKVDEKLQNKYLPLLLVAGFFAGLVAARFGALIGGKEGQPGWYQDIQAWLALLAMIGLGAEVIIQLVINPTLEEEKQIHLPQLENILAAVVGFYFGARS